MSRYFKEAVAAALAAAPESDKIRLFLTRLFEDPNCCVDHIWEGYLAKGQKDGSAERVDFIKNLVRVFCASMNAEDSAKILDIARSLKRIAAERYKSLSKVLANESVAAEEKLRLLERVGKSIRLIATFDKEKHVLQRWHIRSDRDGTRSRTAFMRAAANLFHRETGEWRDDWVVDLTNAAYPDAEATIDMARSARRGIRP